MKKKNIPADNEQRTDMLTVQNNPDSVAGTEALRFLRARKTASRLLFGIAAVLVLVLIGGYLITGDAQYSALLATAGVATAFFFAAVLLVNRGRDNMGANALMWGVLLAFVMAGNTYSGLSLALVIGVLALSNALGYLILPGRVWWQTLISSILAAVGVVWADISGLQRWGPEAGQGVTIITTVAIAVAVVGVLVVLYTAYRRVVRLGVRLAVVFIVLVNVAVGITAGVVFVGVSYAARQQGIRELETTAQLKRNAIQSWIGTLHSELGNIINESYEQTRARSVLLEEGSLELRRASQSELEVLMQNVVARNFNFIEIYLINPDGKVIVSSERNNEDKWVDHEPFFLYGQNSEFVDQPRFSVSDGGLVMVFSQPIYDSLGFDIGVIAGKANLAKLNSLVSASPSGVSGKTYLVAGNHQIVGQQNFVYSSGIESALRDTTNAGVYEDYAGTRVLGYYQRLPEFSAALMNEIDEVEVLSTGRRVVVPILVITSVVVSVLAVAAGILLARSISRPLSQLGATAGRIAAGERTLRAEVVTQDEIGELAQAFNIMTDELQVFISGLEQRVQERTDNLAAVGEVTRATASELDINDLLPTVVDAVRERFNLYYVGLFLVEEQSDGTRAAVLRAATGDAGTQMLAQGWQLDAGGGSMIGDAIATGQPGVRQSSTASGAWQRNQYLPLTESELALPLRFGGRVLGAMTVQSTEVDAFDDAFIEVGLNLADQMAVAIENARLYTESQRALQRAAVIQQRYQSRAWRDYLTAQEIRGVSYSGVLGMETLRAAQMPVPALPDGVKIEDGKLLVPIMQGSQQVGVLGFEGKEGGWQPEEIALLLAMTEQLSQTAENQRLLEETQRRAAREQTVAQVADSLRRSLDMDTVLSTAAGEIREALGLDRIVVRLAEPEQSE